MNYRYQCRDSVIPAAMSDVHAFRRSRLCRPWWQRVSPCSRTLPSTRSIRCAGITGKVYGAVDIVDAMIRSFFLPRLSITLARFLKEIYSFHDGNFLRVFTFSSNMREVWFEQNRRVFQNQGKTIPQLLAKIQDKIKLWSICEAKHIAKISV